VGVVKKIEKKGFRETVGQKDWAEGRKKEYASRI
jgi:hypothetical protein